MSSRPSEQDAAAAIPPPSLPPSPSSRTKSAEPSLRSRGLAIAALGVVFGDIGTSPLYSVKECFSGPHAIAPTPANIYGALSLIVYTLTFVVTVKYLTFILRADNQGEGGILSLLALVPRKEGARRAGPGLLALVVLFGAALLYGDGVITPAISVLSAIEGLEASGISQLRPAAVPLTLLVLLVVFLVQKKGTSRVARIFGPVMLVWFSTIALLGLSQVVRHSEILLALDPRYAVQFFVTNRLHGFLVLGAVVLCITGVEALYADMGHFGRAPIRRAWFGVAFPALLLNYFGQGALLLEDPSASGNPFYGLVPSWAIYPVVAIATMATVVASQALISGAYSLTQQAVQLGFFPRVSIVHTSKETEGQIYVPEINAFLLVCCVGLVLLFQNSGALAAAYGIAATGTMTITSIVFFVVATRTWKWPLWKAGPLLATFLAIDLAFLGAAASKFVDGGWFPVVLALAIFTVMTTWHRGRRFLADTLADQMLPLASFLEDLGQTKPPRVRGTAVFMTANPGGVPPVLLHHFKHNQCLHEQVVLLTVASMHVPEVPRGERATVEALEHGFWKVTLRYGFMQAPDVPLALAECRSLGLVMDPDRTSYFVGRETLLPTGRAKMARWRKMLFAFVSRNARPATAYFRLPPNRVVELGMQLDF